MSNGNLKLVSINGGRPETLPFHMNWTPQQPNDTIVIHAGRLWDGTSPEMKENADIILRGDRIAEIKPHKQPHNPHNGKFIDASELTVIPGLWDAHMHQELSQAFIGSRQGRQLLSFGITSTISMSDYAYRAIEDRESIQSGTRLAPRFFASGELIEGSRVYYSNMRPTTNMEALKRELERAEALDVDVLKTYVRLPNDHQAYVINTGHNLGIPTFSHYFFPSMAFGQDAMSHISATQRLGFPRSQSPSGYAYEDVIKLAGSSGMSVTSSMFARTMLGFDPGLISDPRITTLYTPWQYNNFKGSYDRVTTTDQSSARKKLAKDVSILKEIMNSGGIVLNGTDAPLIDMGVSTHYELPAMVEYGITPYEALRTATYYPAVKMGVADDLGTIEPGKLADLVFVGGNPLEDINDADNVQMVMKNGELYTIEE